jgi:hypothetical protein
MQEVKQKLAANKNGQTKENAIKGNSNHKLVFFTLQRYCAIRDLLC